MAPSELARRVLPFLERIAVAAPDLVLLEQAVAISQEKVKTLTELAEMIRFFFISPHAVGVPEIAALLSDTAALAQLREVRERLADVEPWTLDAIKAALSATCASLDIKLKTLAQTIRLYLTGSTVSPSLFESFLILGKSDSLKRLDLS